MSSSDLFGNVVFSYSRAQAIQDGVLVDLSQHEISRQYWKLPIACTEAVWRIVENAVHTHDQDIPGTLHDIYTFAKLAVMKASGAQQTHFTARIGRRLVAFKLHIGPGDTPAPVLTLMLPDED